MVESLGDLIVEAYNANEKRNYYMVKKKLNLAIKMLDNVNGILDGMKSKLDDYTENDTHV